MKGRVSRSEGESEQESRVESAGVKKGEELCTELSVGNMYCIPFVKTCKEDSKV